MNPAGYNNDQRRDVRVSVDFPVKLSIGTQLTVEGRLRDLSAKSAFIRVRHSVFLSMNDEVGVAIQCSATNADDVVQGRARISRIDPGEGVAVYFTKMDSASEERLKAFLQKQG